MNNEKSVKFLSYNEKEKILGWLFFSLTQEAGLRKRIVKSPYL